MTVQNVLAKKALMIVVIGDSLYSKFIAAFFQCSAQALLEKQPASEINQYRLK